MKKNLLFLAAATAVAFAACNGGSDEGKLTPAQADSIANVKVDSAKAAMKNANDSAMSATAMANARTADSLRVIDSIIAATKKSVPATVTKTVVVKHHGGKGTKGSGTTETTTTTTEPAQPTAPTNEDKKAARFNDDQAAKAKVQQSSTDAKAARFKQNN